MKAACQEILSVCHFEHACHRFANLGGVFAWRAWKKDKEKTQSRYLVWTQGPSKYKTGFPHHSPKPYRHKTMRHLISNKSVGQHLFDTSVKSETPSNETQRTLYVVSFADTTTEVAHPSQTASGGKSCRSSTAKTCSARLAQIYITRRLRLSQR